MTEVRNIIILAPTQTEASALTAAAARHGAGVTVSGVGTAETAATLVSLYGAGQLCGPVVLAGVGGAYPGSGFTHGDCAAAISETMANLGAVREGAFVPLFQKRYICPTAENLRGLPHAHFATVDRIDGNISCESGYGIENMEGAAFFAVMSALGLPFLEVRAVSNLTTDRRENWRIPEALEALASRIGDVIEELKYGAL